MLPSCKLELRYRTVITANRVISTHGYTLLQSQPTIASVMISQLGKLSKGWKAPLKSKNLYSSPNKIMFQAFWLSFKNTKIHNGSVMCLYPGLNADLLITRLFSN